jgi:penicillin-binding protein-related factor A (putative recombinase)
MLHKIPTPSTVRSGRLVFTAKSTVDYVGLMLDGTGRALALEAKAVGDTRLDLGRVAPHQRAYLDRVVGAGGVAVLGVIDSRWQVYDVPWEVVRSRPSLSLVDLEPFASAPKTWLRRFVKVPR